jgi:multiple sugar transport system substrate-binding protein
METVPGTTLQRLGQGRRVSRRQLLQATGAAALAASAGPLLAACGGGGGGGGGKKQLKILQWSHFVPRYDTWFDGYVKKWGSDNGVTVTVNHIDLADLSARTAAEISSGSGHDLIELLSPPSAFEPSAQDLTHVNKEAEKRFGQQLMLCKNSTYNPTTDKYYGFCHGWVPDPGDYRKSQWDKVGLANGPSTWDDLLTGGTKIKQQANVRMGIGMSQEIDSNMAARALIWSFGGSVQDGNENVVINSPQVVDAVEYMVKLFKSTMTNEVFSWTASSNNEGLISGELSYILNSISAYRSAQDASPDVADDVFFTKALTGPGGQGFASAHVIPIYIVPKFSKNLDTAEQFLLDLVKNYGEAVNNSELYNFPAFPSTAPKLSTWLQKDPFGSKPSDKLAVLQGAEQWSTNVGHPGPANAAIGEVFGTFVLPNMMASAARGKATPKDAVANAEAQIKPIFAKWQKKGLVGGGS